MFGVKIVMLHLGVYQQFILLADNDELTEFLKVLEMHIVFERMYLIFHILKNIFSHYNM